MKYQAPFGSVDPAAPFVDRNTPAADVGSKIPAGFPNWTQNEIIDAINKSGIAPVDVLQLAKAIQSQKMNYVVAGGAVNAITAVLSPAPASWADLVGVPIRLVASTSPTIRRWCWRRVAFSQRDISSARSHIRVICLRLCPGCHLMVRSALLCGGWRTRARSVVSLSIASEKSCRAGRQD
jgi:hypothetical protein